MFAISNIFRSENTPETNNIFLTKKAKKHYLLGTRDRTMTLNAPSDSELCLYGNSLDWNGFKITNKQKCVLFLRNYVDEIFFLLNRCLQYNFVIHIFSASRTVLKVGTLTPYFITGRLCNQFYWIGHDHFFAFRHYIYYYGCTRSKVEGGGEEGLYFKYFICI